MFNINDYLSGERSSSDIQQVDKDSILDAVNPNAAQLYYKYGSWRIAVLNKATKKRFAMKLTADFDVPKVYQDAADNMGKAAAILAVTPADKKAAKLLAESAPLVKQFIMDTFDSDDSYIYAGTSNKNDEKFVVLSPNAPGEGVEIPTVEFESSLATV